MATQEERSEATRRRLLDIAQQRFAAAGFASASIEEIAASAGMTKGALYHHFADKKALFAEVFEKIQQRLIEAAVAGSRGSNSLQRLKSGCRAFLEASLEPAAQRIAMCEAPAALGWETWHEIDLRYGVGLIERQLRAAMSEGLIAERPPETLARLLFGAICEGARAIAAASDQKKTFKNVVQEIDELIDGLQVTRR